MPDDYERQVYYHDTDAGGVVYYGRYLDFLEEARTDLLARRGVDAARWHRQGIVFAVRECRLVYKRPARYGDRLRCATAVTRVTGVRIIMRQTVFRKNTDELLLEAEVHLVCVSPEFSLTAIPREIANQL
jgi:acyl-CoA thioester hydrolase